MKKFNFLKEKETLVESENAFSGQLGQMLLQKRIALGLEQKDLAERLYTFSELIDHLENENFDRLSHLTKSHLKGFLKRYAEVVHLDFEEVLDLFEKVYVEVKPKNNEKLYLDYISNERRGFNFKHLKWMVSFGVLVIAVLVLFNLGGSTEQAQYETIILQH